MELLGLTTGTAVPDPGRTRAVLVKLDVLTRRGRPFGDFVGGPPLRKSGEPPIHPHSIAVSAANLGQFGSLCMNLHELPGDGPLPPLRVWRFLFSHVPIVLDWVGFIHPMNGNIRADSETDGNSFVCTVVTTVLQGITMPDLYKANLETDQMRNFLPRTPFAVYVSDLWVNLFRYVSKPAEETVALAVKLLHTTMYRILQPTVNVHIPEPVDSVVSQETRSNPRRLSRIIARYAAELEGPDHNKDAGPLLFHIAVSLTTLPGLAVRACPRDTVRTLAKTLGNDADSNCWTVTTMGLCYFETLWRMSNNHRIVEWSINDGIFDVFLRTLMSRHSGAADPLGEVAHTFHDNLVYWRVLYAFHKKHHHEIPMLRPLAKQFPVLNNLVIAYEERSIVLQAARNEWTEMRQRCSYHQCQHHTEGTLLRQCSCRGAWYCSLNCQRKHWGEWHHKRCAAMDANNHGKTTPRDLHFIALLCVTHLRKNKDSILADILALDPSHRHLLSIGVNLQSPTIMHMVGIFQDRVPEETWLGMIYASWREGGEERTAPMQRAINLDDWEEKVELPL